MSLFCNTSLAIKRKDDNMIFPAFLKAGDTIGVTAPSAGVSKPADINRFNNAKKKLEERGYKVIFTKNVFSDDGHGRSTDAITRSKEFMELIENPQVKYICSAKGGDFLMEILPYLDYEKISKNPKWIQGFSDNTSLTLGISTKCNIATVYGNNFGDFGMEEYHQSVEENLEILEGRLVTQKSYPMYEDGFYDRVTGVEGYTLTKSVSLKLYNGNDVDGARFSGRAIGGCLDVITDILGTPFEAVKKFVDENKEEGIIWYIESFLNNSEGVVRNMWKMKQLGWFENTKGILFGRELMYERFSDTDFDAACMSVLKELNIPVIFGCDIGHKAPQFSMINGAGYEVEFCNQGNGQLKLEIKY